MDPSSIIRRPAVVGRKELIRRATAPKSGLTELSAEQVVTASNDGDAAHDHTDRPAQTLSGPLIDAPLDESATHFEPALEERVRLRQRAYARPSQAAKRPPRADIET